jgi:hypothetical protein
MDENELESWLETTASDLNGKLGIRDDLASRMTDTSALLVPLCDRLNLDQEPSCALILDALEQLTPEERETAISQSITKVRKSEQQFLFQCVEEAAGDLGYDRRRVSSTKATFVASDGTSIRASVDLRGDALGLSLDLHNFADGRCKHVRAAVESGLRKRGIRLRTIAVNDHPAALANLADERGSEERSRLR